MADLHLPPTLPPLFPGLPRHRCQRIPSRRVRNRGPQLQSPQRHRCLAILVGPTEEGVVLGVAAIVLANNATLLSRAGTFSPIAAMEAGGGPMKMMPADSHARAKSWFSLRNP